MQTTKQYIKLSNAYQHYNKKLFTNTLPECLITLQRGKSTYGYYLSNSYQSKTSKKQIDKICLNPDFFSKTEEEVLSTLTHEMVHLWQNHNGTPGKGYHNKEWAQKMEEVGLMPSHTGQPGGQKTGWKISDYIIPGGLFQKATKELLKKKIIDWQGATTNAFENTTLTAARKPGEVFQLSNLSNVKLNTKLMVNNEFFTVTCVDDKTGKVEARPLGGDTEIKKGAKISIINKKHQEKNKIKYTCPSCNMNVWGKPNLNILCGVCNQTLLP